MTFSTYTLRGHLCFLLLISMSLARASDWHKGLQSLPLGHIAPDSFSAELEAKNRSILLQFWASWCQSCSALMFDLEKLQLQHANMRYVAISVDDKVELAMQAESQMASKQFRAPHIFDVDKTWARKFSVVNVPTIVLLDRNGKTCFRHEGHLDATAAMQLSQALIALESNKNGAQHAPK
jgi:thiol-disulfide isomerase/thioredoxin